MVGVISNPNRSDRRRLIGNEVLPNQVVYLSWNSGFKVVVRKKRGVGWDSERG